MSKKHLFISPSIYTLFLYTLINDEWTESDFVLSDRIPMVIHQRLRDLFGVDVYSDISPSKNYPAIKRLLLKDKHWLAYNKYANGRKYQKVWGNDEFYLSMKYRGQGISIIEDGPFNGMPKSFFISRRNKQELTMLPLSLKWIINNYIPYGFDHRVKEIYHTPGIALPLEIKQKGKLVNIKDNWGAKSGHQKSDILRLFGIEKDFVDNINNYKSVLVTQSLPIPDKDKIAIYKRMTHDIAEEEILIKTHYAETTDYQSAFSKSKIMSLPVPMQLFDLLGYRPQKIMTISSSAIQPFIREGVEIVFLGTECDERIKKVYGVVRLENIVG